MNTKMLTYIFYALVLVGLADSMYLSMTVLLGIAPTCGVLHGCDVVAKSSYSRLFGIPLAYLGLLYFVVGAMLGGLMQTSKVWEKVAIFYGAIGALVFCYSLYVQSVLIGAYCVYCVLMATSMLLLLPVTMAIYRHSDWRA